MNIRRKVREHSDWIGPLLIWVYGFVAVVLVMMAYEERSFFDTIYYGFVTATTVGFGDICPSSPQARIVTIVYMMTAIFALGNFINAASARGKALTEKKRRGWIMVKCNPDVVIIGYPSRGKVKKIVTELRTDWPECKIVCITMQIEEKPNWMTNHNVDFVFGRASEKPQLLRGGVDKAANILILANDPVDPVSDEYTSSVVMLCEGMNPDAHTIAEKVRADADLFEGAKCDKIVDVCRPAELAQEIVSAGAIDLIDTMFSSHAAGAQKNKLLSELIPRLTPGIGNMNFDWGNVASELAGKGFVPLGFSKDGKVFEFAPEVDAQVPHDAVIKVLTR